MVCPLLFIVKLEVAMVLAEAALFSHLRSLRGGLFGGS
jgi:hypothetical protein